MNLKLNCRNIYACKLNMYLTGSILAVLFFMGCTLKESGFGGETADIILSEEEFLTVPTDAKPWVYYWWLKGNVTKEAITRDLEEMHKKGIGGFLLFDSRGYWDSYDGKTGHIPVPLNIKHEFMSPGWREMVKYTMHEANRLGLKMSMNIANTGGSLRGPWDMKEDGPKQLIWTSYSISGPSKLLVKLDKPSDKRYFQDVALLAVRVKTGDNFSYKSKAPELNGEWKTVSEPAENSAPYEEIVDLKDKITNGKLQWEVPEGEWQILRFGYHVIGEEGGVDILNTEAVTRYFQLMGAEILKDAGPLAGLTLTHFYNVSWEGGQPDWSVNFENDFEKLRGYDIRPYMPLLAGIPVADSSVNQRFFHDYLRTVSECFIHNCYETIGALCHESGLQWHSENGGPWPRTAPMFKEADQFTFWGKNDMPQGEFWCSGLNDLGTKSNIRYTAMAGHIYGHPLIAVEAFTHMGRHWTKYPAYLKPFADISLIDGANFFIWHTFTASPPEVGKPGYEYFAGTHINTNVTWWNEAGSFFDYLGRCQLMLRKGKFVADVCCYVNDKNYVMWGRGEKWNPNSALVPAKGFSYDLLNSDALTGRLSVKNGRLVLPDGMSYKMLVVDLDEAAIPVEVLKKITELVKEGATIVLGQTRPVRATGISNYPDSDNEVNRLASELWIEGNGLMQVRTLGKGRIYSGGTMPEILKDNNILPDFEGPFEYIHRSGSNADIYFVSGKGNAECTFRVENKKPEIWNPVTGQTSEAISYNSTSDGRTSVLLDLPENGSSFVIFREKAGRSHFTEVTGLGNPELTRKDGNSSEFIFWNSGNYSFTALNGEKYNVQVKLLSELEMQGAWEIVFAPATGAEGWETTFKELTLWNEHPDPQIKYFSGTASYSRSFTLTSEQAKLPARLQMGEIHDISRVWVNGKDLGTLWTFPWTVNLAGCLKEGVNELKIEVTNCWANRLIGDAGLPENQWTTKTNVRRVADRSEYPQGHQAFSARDELMPSGLLGPVGICFGLEQTVITHP